MSSAVVVTVDDNQSVVKVVPGCQCGIPVWSFQTKILNSTLDCSRSLLVPLDIFKCAYSKSKKTSVSELLRKRHGNTTQPKSLSVASEYDLDQRFFRLNLKSTKVTFGVGSSLRHAICGWGAYGYGSRYQHLVHGSEHGWPTKTHITLMLERHGILILTWRERCHRVC